MLKSLKDSCQQGKNFATISIIGTKLEKELTIDDILINEEVNENDKNRINPILNIILQIVVWFYNQNRVVKTLMLIVLVLIYFMNMLNRRLSRLDTPDQNYDDL